jgi:hypothetical protein
MAVELASAFLLWRGHSGLLESLGLGLVVLLWLSTLVFFAPLHGRLSQGFDPARWRLLVKANWGRTWLWSLRGILVIFFVR